MTNNNPEPSTQTLAETDNFQAWRAEEPDEDGLFMLEFDNVDVWMDEEDWLEFKSLASALRK